MPQEQRYALHHLVKISHERGDKYKFEAFPNLAESLIDHVLRVSTLFYDVKWDIEYSDGPHELNVLDGINGTPDILQRVRMLKRHDATDGLETESYSECMTKVHEAALTIRNLSLLEDNAIYLASLPQTKDFLAIVLSLPASPDIAELKHYALDTTEQVTKYWKLDVNDPVYQCLLTLLDESHDRGIIFTALRAISRISMDLEISNSLGGVPTSVLGRILNWTLLQDDDLVNACLDFLYQFTAIPGNVAILLSNCDDLSTVSFIAQLARLLQHGARPTQQQFRVQRGIRASAPHDIVDLPEDLLHEFLKYDEPARSTHWLKACFEEDADSEVTQIALWQAYQARFSAYAPEKALLQAADFIKNVSVAFTKANAHVAANKYIMRGIRPRRLPADSTGRSYSRCLWTPHGQSTCGQFFLTPKKMFDHVVAVHLNVPTTDEGKWDFSSIQTTSSAYLDCHWAGCRHFLRQSCDQPTIFAVGLHVKTHMSDAVDQASSREKHDRTLATQTTLPNETDIKAVGQSREEVWSSKTSYNTTVNERGEATGLPLNSLYVLRNIARNVPKAVTLLEEGPDFYEAPKKDNWVERLFSPLREQFLYVVAHNPAMSGHVTTLLDLIDQNSG